MLIAHKIAHKNAHKIAHKIAHKTTLDPNKKQATYFVMAAGTVCFAEIKHSWVGGLAAWASQ